MYKKNKTLESTMNLASESPRRDSLQSAEIF